MDEAGGVRVVERLGHLGDQGDGAARLQRAPPTALEDPGEVDARDEAHVEEQPAVDLAEVVQRDDVRVLQLRGGVRLAAEALPEHLVAREVVGQQLEGDGPAAAGVEGAVHGAHAAAAELVLDPVGPELHPVPLPPRPVVPRSPRVSRSAARSVIMDP